MDKKLEPNRILQLRSLGCQAQGDGFVKVGLGLRFRVYEILAFKA